MLISSGLESKMVLIKCVG